LGWGGWCQIKNNGASCNPAPMVIASGAVDRSHLSPFAPLSESSSSSFFSQDLVPTEVTNKYLLACFFFSPFSSQINYAKSVHLHAFLTSLPCLPYAEASWILEIIRVNGRSQRCATCFFLKKNIRGCYFISYDCCFLHDAYCQLGLSFFSPSLSHFLMY